MNIDDLTIGQARETHAMVGVNTTPKQRNHSFVVGECYLIRTVTMTYTGRLDAITETDFVLGNAAWIADSGRFADALSRGTLEEVEPYPSSVLVSRASYVDAAIWAHDLPREQK